ncbi:hypothetical protein [Microlunatus sp. GCM10028923]|uniref:hypothetical protein n=1 Tax=Microlunatus sp. GCM10028923 TaxID=3273400 RepID=UPI003614898D
MTRPDHKVPSRQPDATSAEKAPTALPLVVITVAEPGTLDVTVDGRPFPARDDSEPWTRSTFAGLIDALTHHRRIPIRLEIHETNGTTFTDIIPKHRTTADTKTAQPPPLATEPRSATKTPEPEPASLIDIAGSGFVAGEEIAVTAVVAETAAGPDGSGHLRIEAELLRGAPEIMIIGRVSGVVMTRRLP